MDAQTLPVVLETYQAIHDRLTYEVSHGRPYLLLYGQYEAKILIGAFPVMEEALAMLRWDLACSTRERRYYHVQEGRVM